MSENSGDAIKNFVEVVSQHGKEYDVKGSADLLAATLDVLYYTTQESTGIDMWNGGGITVITDQESTLGKKQISFYPVPLSEETRRKNPDNKIGLFVVSNTKGETVGSIGLECKLSNNGHINLKGSVAPTNHLSMDQMIQAVSIVGSTAVKNALQP